MTTLTSPLDLLSAIPFLVGYTPEDSIVLISLRDDSIDVAMRIDFPSSLDTQSLQNLVDHLHRNRAEAAILVSYIPDTCMDADVILKWLIDAIDEREIPLRESIVVVAGRWRSMFCDDNECCPIEGSELPQLESSRIAAEQVAQGKPLPFPSVDAMIDSLAHIEDETLTAKIAEIPPIDYSNKPEVRQRIGAGAIIDFLHDFESDGICRDKGLVATALFYLRDLQVRDFALGSVSLENSDLCFAAWRWMLRIAPRGYVAPVATIFAAICYERGDGAMAQRALDRADEDEPGYALTHLLREVFKAGLPPTIFASMRSELHPKVCEAIFSGSMKA